MTILNLNISYPDFQLGDVIDPQSFDLNNSEIVTKINEIKNVVNTLTDGTTGAANISLAAITPFASTKVQAFLQEMVDRLKATAAGVSGSDFVGTPAIAGVTGATVGAQLASFKSLLDTLTTNTTNALTTHKTSTDHDGRYYTESEIDAKITTLNTTNTNQDTNLTNHKTSSDHDGRYYTETELNAGQLDTRYFTETELGSVTSGSSGAKKVGATPISTSPSDVQGILEWLKNQIDSAVTGTIPDGSLTPVKFSFDIATQAELDTHSSTSSHIPYVVGGGVANWYSATLSPAPTSYTDGMAISVKININADSACNIDVNGLGNKAIVKSNGSAVNNLKANGVYTFRYNATTGNFILQGEGGGGTAVAANILAGKTAAVDSGDVTGTMVDRGAVAITPSASSQAITQGYHNGSGSVAAVTFTASNVRAGTTIAGTAGTMVDRGAMAISAGSTNQTIPVGYHNGSGVVNAVPVDATKVLTGTTIAGTAGTMPNRNAGANPATSVGQWPDGGLAVYLEGGYYAGGAGAGEVKVTSAQLQSVEGDLVAANIVSGKNIYGIVGTFAGVDLINISAPSLIGENNTTATIKKSVTMNKTGNVTVRAGMRNPNVNGDVYGYFRKNGVQFPAGVYGVGSNQTPNYWSALVSVVPGDVIDVVTYSTNGGAYNGVQDLTIVTTMPSSPTGGTITLGA